MLTFNKDNWQKKNYSKIWLERVNIYGFDYYCQNFIKLILNKKPKKVYEVGLGTGWPVAHTLLNNNIEVSGSDISEILIEELKKNYPNVNAKVLSYNKIKENENNNYYDITYCFRSMWYLTNQYNAIDNMVALTRNNGYVIFDIINLDSPKIINLFIKPYYIVYIVFKFLSLFSIIINPIVFSLYFKQFYLLLIDGIKNIIKFVINNLLKTNYKYAMYNMLLFNQTEIYTSPQKLDTYLNFNKIKFTKISLEQLESNFKHSFCYDSLRIIYLCKIIKN